MNPMSPKQIKRSIEDAGYTQVMIAHELGVSTPTVSQVIRGLRTSHRIRCHIAQIIDMPVTNVFDVKTEPTKPGPVPSVSRLHTCTN
jgi:transcriptional regulator with XRE-family HTH domain